MFCPLYLDNILFSDHAESTAEKLSFWNFLDFYNHGGFLLNSLTLFIFNNIVLYIFLFVLAYFKPSMLTLDKFKNFDWKTLSVVFLAILIYLYIAVTIAPFDDVESNRYIFSCFPIVSILLTLITYCFRNVIIYLLLILAFFTSFIPIKTNLSPIESKYKNLGNVIFYNEFSHFVVNDYLYNEEGKLRPIVITNRSWQVQDYLFYIPNETIVRFEEEDFPKKNKILDDYLLINSGEEQVSHIYKQKKGGNFYSIDYLIGFD